MKHAFWVGCLILLSCGSTPQASEGSPIPDADEATLGDAIHGLLIQETDGLYVDRDLSSYVDQVGRRLVDVVQKHYARKLNFRFHILNTSGLDVIPSLGGNIYVTRGLIQACMNEDQLAAALAHGLVHSGAGHTGIRLTQELALGTLPQELRNPRLGIDEPHLNAATWRRLSRFTDFIVKHRYDRDIEENSDTLAFRVVYEAGYNPRAMIQFLETVERRPAGQTPFRSRHPGPGSRLADLEAVMKQYYAEADTREFNAHRFETTTTRIKAEREAYEAYDNGMAAVDSDPARAAECFVKALEMKKEAIFHRGLALAYFKAQNYKLAEQSYANGLALSTAIESLYAGRALARIRLSRFAEAIDDLKWAARLAKRPSTYFWMGDCAERSRDNVLAQRAYRNCVALAGYDSEPPENAPSEIRMAWRRLK